MDIIRSVYKARPDATWKNNSVNGFNLDTVKAAYIGDDFPTQTELDEAWLDCLREDKKAQTKKEAYRRIVTILPEWKQRNYTAKSVELTEKKVDGGILTQDELDELSTIKAKWVEIQQIRAASDNIEAELDSTAAVEAYEIENCSLWP